MSRLAARLEQLRKSPDYEFELRNLEVSDAIAGRMQELGLTQAELARRMGVSRARVTQILRGSDNLTLRTLVLLSHALESRLVVGFEPVEGPAPSSRERTILPAGQVERMAVERSTAHPDDATPGTRLPAAPEGHPVPR